MNHDPVPVLQQQVQALQAENYQLRQELERIRQQAELASQARAQVLRGGGRLLIPLLDRQRVVRSFSKFAETVSNFAGPMQGWPERERVLVDAREFLESCVRFMIRRRTMMWLFSLLATTVPAIQIWLVVQQNEIIRNQTKLGEIQVYDIVSRSMTEGDRNAKLMTGALLSRADLEFLAGVVQETFDPELASVYRAEGVGAKELRLRDAAFRGALIRAVVRATEVRQGEVSAADLHAQVQPMLHRVVLDAADRVPGLLRLGAEGAPVDPELAEQVDSYLYQVGEALRIYGRLARSHDELEPYHADLEAFLRRVATRTVDGNAFAASYTAALESVVLEAGTEPDLDDPPSDWGEASVDEATAQGLKRLEQTLGADAVAWDKVRAQLGGAR